MTMSEDALKEAFDGAIKKTLTSMNEGMGSSLRAAHEEFLKKV